MLTEEKIKTLLDEDCLSSGQCRGEYQHCIDSSGLPCRVRVQCWQCHKNDELSQRISEVKE